MKAKAKRSTPRRSRPPTTRAAKPTLVLVVGQDPKKPWRWLGSLEGRIIVNSEQPLVDAARVLLKEGYPPDTLLTMRHEGSVNASFEPMPIREWAKFAYWDTATRFRRVRWKPHPRECPASRCGEGKSGVSDEAPLHG
jgi:hypothetical protein